MSGMFFHPGIPYMFYFNTLKSLIISRLIQLHSSSNHHIFNNWSSQVVFFCIPFRHTVVRSRGKTNHILTTVRRSSSILQGRNGIKFTDRFDPAQLSIGKSRHGLTPSVITTSKKKMNILIVSVCLDIAQKINITIFLLLIFSFTPNYGLQVERGISF